MDPGRGSERTDLAPPGGEPAIPPRPRLTLGSPLLWHLLSLVAGAVFLMYVNRAQWFFGDEWDFLADRSVTIGDDGLLEPHNEHWSTTPILIYGLLFRVVGLTSYAPYVAVLVLAHLAVVHLMWRVMLRTRVDPWIATAFCAAFIPYGPGADNLLWAFQIGFVGSVALGLAAILLADHPGSFDRRDRLGWGASVLGLTFSGIAIPLVGASAAVAWIRRGFRAFLLAASVPVTVFALWFVTVGRSGLPEEGPTTDSLRVFPQFLGRGIGATLSMGTPTVLAGAIPLGLSAIAVALRRRRGDALPYAAIGAALGFVLLLVILAVGRAPLGLEVAEATRYVHIGGALLLPLLLLGLSDLASRHVVGVVLVAALAVPFGVHNARILVDRAGLQAERERLIREQIVAAGTLFDSSPVLLRGRPDPIYTPDLDLSELELLLPRFPDGVIPGREAIIRASLALQVSVTPRPEFSTAVPISGIRPFDASILPGPGGCLDVRPIAPKPRILVPLGPPSSVGLRSGTTAETPVGLLLSAGGIRPDYEGFLEVRPRRTLYLNMAIDQSLVGEAAFVVRFLQPLLVCPVDAAAGEP